MKAVEKFRDAPKILGDVRSLLGFLGYYRTYVRHFAKKLKPVYDLLKTNTGLVTDGGYTEGGYTEGYNKSTVVEWNSTLQGCADDVINTLQSPRVMAFPYFESQLV